MYKIIHTLLDIDECSDGTHYGNLHLSSIPWKSFLSQNDVNYSWLIFRNLLKVIKPTIPSKLGFHHKSPSWSNDHPLACIKRKHRLFTLAKQTRSSFLMSLYRFLILLLELTFLMISFVVAFFNLPHSQC